MKLSQNFKATLVSLGTFALFSALLKFNILISGALSVATYFGTYMLAKPRLRLGNVDLDALENGAELNELMLEAQRDLDTYKFSLEKVEDEAIKKKAVELYQMGLNLTGYLKENPSKISKARRFLNYYLETSKNILVQYVNFEKTKITTDELSKIYEKTDTALTILQDAYKKQFVKLARNEIIDLESDIELLETTLKEEG